MDSNPGTESKRGSLVAVGSGIQIGRHISERTISEIHHADTIFYLADGFAALWLEENRPDAIGLQPYYGDDKDRRDSYREMVEVITSAVFAGHNVCLVMYGHPGVFAQVPHSAIKVVREAGYEARMEPGISAEACLYADLGIDPGHSGVQSFEATQFLVFRHPPDPSALLLLWQVALSGSLDCVGFEAHPARLKVLVDKLTQWYPPDTEVILYEAAQLPIEDFRADYLALAALPQASYKEYTTLVIPPAIALERDEHYWNALRKLE